MAQRTICAMSVETTTVEKAIEDDQLMVTVVYDWNVRGDPVWTPGALADSFLGLAPLFELATQMAAADNPHVHRPRSQREFPAEILERSARARSGKQPRAEREADLAAELRKRSTHLEVIDLRLGSLEIVALVGALASAPKVLRYLIALVEDAYTLKARIIRRREEDGAAALKAKVEQEQAKQELVRLASQNLGIRRTKVVSMVFWMGEDEPPAELATVEDH
jgi:hypothetical protein